MSSSFADEPSNRAKEGGAKTVRAHAASVFGKLTVTTLTPISHSEAEL
jgi:hypothetical protein